MQVEWMGLHRLFSRAVHRAFWAALNADSAERVTFAKGVLYSQPRFVSGRPSKQAGQTSKAVAHCDDRETAETRSEQLLHTDGLDQIARRDDLHDKLA